MLFLSAFVAACGTDQKRSAPKSEVPACATEAKAASLPLPSEVGRTEYLELLQTFLKTFEYRKLGWCEDKGKVRDTGPYIDDVGYQGTHPPVHMAYSPEAIEWLLDGRKEGEIPDGTLVIKEQWYAVEVNGKVRNMMPAAAYQDLSREQLDDLFFSRPVQAGWTTMIRDSKGSTDGWFWAEIYDGMKPNDLDSFEFLVANFGSPCERCHASAEVDSTFISLENVAGFPDEPLTYKIDPGWQTQDFTSPGDDHYKTSPDYKAYPKAFTPWLPGTKSLSDPAPDKNWLSQYSAIAEVPRQDVADFPPASLDHVPHPPEEQYFVTADQCLGCHGGLQTMGFPMFENNEQLGAMGTDISPSGDWRFTPMGLAGRDPIFYSQLESEISMVAADYPEAEVAAFTQGLVDTCMSCHGGPGVRQAQMDKVTFSKDFVMISDPSDENFKYGALARDGINCTMCHHIADKGTEADFFADYTTGRFELSPADVIYGPFKDNTLHPKPMEHGVGYTPQYNADVADSNNSSRLCGHCHTINLPVVDDPKVAGTRPSEAFPVDYNNSDYPFPIHPEQSTYTEWLNSEFQTIFGPPGAKAQSCQDCHMPKKFLGEEIDTIVASIQDASYPETTHQLPDLALQSRKNYGRHQFVGLNVPLLQMFNQFYDILGVNKKNYMTGLSTSLNNTIATMLDQAANKTVTLDTQVKIENDSIVADITLTNRTGHRFPSGVAFRRAWLEVLLLDETGNVMWGSGRSNDVGVIVDQTGAPLPTEFFENNEWQPHYDTIDSQNQVQIYEEVPLNKRGDVTYSFLRRDSEPKDNRLLPRGWTSEGPSNTLPASVIESTHPHGKAKEDPRYGDGSGSDTISYRIALPPNVEATDLRVQVSVYYQSTSPAFLQEKFHWSPSGPATKRLYYLMSNLKTEGTGIDGWKLPLTSQTIAVE